MMIGTQLGELTVMGLWTAVWQEEGSSQCPVSRPHEPVPCQLCPWHSRLQLDELVVEMHREPLCGGSAVESESKAGASCAIPGSSGPDIGDRWILGLDLICDRDGGGGGGKESRLWEQSS